MRNRSLGTVAGSQLPRGSPHPKMHRFSCTNLTTSIRSPLHRPIVTTSSEAPGQAEPPHRHVAPKRSRPLPLDGHRLKPLARLKSLSFELRRTCRQALHVPSMRFLTASTGFSVSALRAYCIPLPVLRFAAFRRPKSTPRSAADPSKCPMSTAVPRSWAIRTEVQTDLHPRSLPP